MGAQGRRKKKRSAQWVAQQLSAFLGALCQKMQTAPPLCLCASVSRTIPAPWFLKSRITTGKVLAKSSAIRVHPSKPVLGSQTNGHGLLKTQTVPSVNIRFNPTTKRGSLEWVLNSPKTPKLGSQNGFDQSISPISSDMHPCGMAKSSSPGVCIFLSRPALRFAHGPFDQKSLGFPGKCHKTTGIESQSKQSICSEPKAIKTIHYLNGSSTTRPETLQLLRLPSADMSGSQPLQIPEPRALSQSKRYERGPKPMWLWVKTLNPGEHQHRWQMDVHPPQNGAIGYAPWPC